jgi:hypothetical protein
MRPAAMLLVLAFVASCSGGGETVSFPKPTDEPAPAQKADADFLDFEASRLGGSGQVTGSELQGKDVAMWFWAPW